MTFSILQLTFDIPNVPTLKQKCLSSVAEKFRGFKTKLTSRYVLGHLRDGRYVYLKSLVAQLIIVQNFN